MMPSLLVNYQIQRCGFLPTCFTYDVSNSLLLQVTPYSHWPGWHFMWRQESCSKSSSISGAMQFTNLTKTLTDCEKDIIATCNTVNFSTNTTFTDDCGLCQVYCNIEDFGLVNDAPLWWISVCIIPSHATPTVYMVNDVSCKNVS